MTGISTVGSLLPRRCDRLGLLLFGTGFFEADSFTTFVTIFAELDLVAFINEHDTPFSCALWRCGNEAEELVVVVEVDGLLAAAFVFLRAFCDSLLLSEFWDLEREFKYTGILVLGLIPFVDTDGIGSLRHGSLVVVGHGPNLITETKIRRTQWITKNASTLIVKLTDKYLRVEVIIWGRLFLV